MGRLIPQEESLARLLTGKKRIEAYLNAALEEDDPRAFLAAVRNVIKVKGGFTEISKAAKLNREHLYKSFSAKGNPRFDSLTATLNAIGYKIWIKPDPKTKGRFKPKKVKREKMSA
ncbi:MAG: putative addiction module antidote protein [Nitrospinae bacterium CG11_big_fil_rev_8_21_14_0_20_56_8]|nr:MAG: putative addiction module antidote protein [Nitrospinae bacterium CG11_big_fil_rev_8_21_14_0_20_56_8]